MMRWSNSVACRDEGKGEGEGEAGPSNYVRTYVRTHVPIWNQPALGAGPFDMLGTGPLRGQALRFFFGTTWDIPFKIVGTVRSWDGLAK